MESSERFSKQQHNAQLQKFQLHFADGPEKKFSKSSREIFLLDYAKINKII